jgi:hypothetical protein
MVRTQTTRRNVNRSSIECARLNPNDAYGAGMPASRRASRNPANSRRKRGGLETVSRRMNSPSDVAVVTLEAGCSRIMDGRILCGSFADRGDFAGGSLTTRARIQTAHDRDIGRWKRNPMKTKLLLALVSIAMLSAFGCASAAPRHHAYSLPKYQASVEVQAPIGKEPEVVARITFGELGGAR